MRITQWPHKLRRFGGLSSADKWLFLRAVAWLAVARVMLIVLSFRRLSTRLSAGDNASSETPGQEYLQRVSFAMAAAASNVPWRSDCFPQAIAARMLLSRQGYGSTIHLGFEKAAPDTVAGHAWLTCGDTVVTGGEQVGRYAEIHRLGE